MRQRANIERSTASRSVNSNEDLQPDPDPEPPAAPPIIILSNQSGVGSAPRHEQDPAFQPHETTSLEASQERSTTSRYNFRGRKDDLPTARGDPESPEPDPFPAAPPVIILSNKRPASTSPPRSPPSIQTTTSFPPSSSHLHSATSASPTATSPTDLSKPNYAIPYDTHPVSAGDTPTFHKHNMGSKASKLAPSGGKLQPAQAKQDKEEMKEPSNYYTHRSKSMRRKAGKTGATSNVGGSAGGGGGGAGGMA